MMRKKEHFVILIFWVVKCSFEWLKPNSWRLFFSRRYIYTLGIRPAANWPLLGKDIHSGCSNLKIEDNEVLGIIGIYIYMYLYVYIFIYIHIIVCIYIYIIQCLWNRVYICWHNGLSRIFVVLDLLVYLFEAFTFWMSGLCAGEGSTSASATRGESEGRSVMGSWIKFVSHRIHGMFGYEYATHIYCKRSTKYV